MEQQLQTQLTDNFDLNELEDLCFRLGVDKDNLPTNKDAFIRELIRYFQRRQKLNKLVAELHTLRPQVEWPEIPESPADRLQYVRMEIGSKYVEIEDIFPQISNFLKKLVKHGITQSDEDSLKNLEKFVNGNISSNDLFEFWSNLQSTKQVNISTFNYSDLAERLNHGDIALFLGNQLSENLGAKLAEADHINANRGSFSEICEHLEHAGRKTLLRKISTLQDNGTIQHENNRIISYKLFSQIQAPLLLISATYDTILEDNFRQNKKPFKLITHCTQSDEIGVLLVQDSGRGEATKTTAEELSKLALMENEFSVIYKIRGCFNNFNTQGFKDTLTLSERDYFNFARYIDNLIPDYLSTKLKALSLWYLGHYPNSWEERLLIHVLQNKRSINGETLAVQYLPDQFAKNYWKAKHIDLYELELTEFIEKLSN